MYLWYAAEGVRILNMNLLLLYDLTSMKEFHEALCSLDLTLMGTYLMNLWVERLYASVKCLKRHRADLVRPV